MISYYRGVFLCQDIQDGKVIVSDENTDDRCLELEDLNIGINNHDAMAIIQSVSKCASATAF